MPVLNWIGKEQVVNHDKEVPFRLLNKDAKFSAGDSENLLIKGDNLEALKALMPYYAGKVKCIYIDPPYNTGNEKWIYNDKVNSPEIKKWLGKVVGSEGEDLNRHDKWLCMMYPRLKLLRELLREDGVIFASIDDNEVHHFQMLMDEIFGEDKFYAMLTWINRTKPTNMGEARFKIQQNIEYVLVYGIVSMKNHPRFTLFRAEEKNYTNKDKIGNYRVEEVVQRRNLGTLRRDTMLYPLLGIKPKKGYRWQLSPGRYEDLISNGRLILIKGKPFQKIYDFEEDKFAYDPFWSHLEEVGTAETGKQELNSILGRGHEFETVKPLDLIKRIIFYSTTFSQNDIVLDSFAGSGTTGHAVIDLNKNKEDKGNRKFILVEMESNIAEEITAERLKRVIKGYSHNGNKVEGLGGGVQFMRLGATLFDKDGFISEDVTFKDLAQYIYFTETKTAINIRAMDGIFIGDRDDTEYYLIFNGIEKNVLDNKILKKINKNQKPKVIYADRCLLDKGALAKYCITFKQIPYEVKVY